MFRYFINITPSSSLASYYPLGRWMTEFSEKEDPQIFVGRYLKNNNFFYETMGCRSCLHWKGFLKKNDPVGMFLASFSRKTGKNCEVTVVQMNENSSPQNGGYYAYFWTAAVKITAITRMGRETRIEGELLLSGERTLGRFQPPQTGLQ